MGDNTSIVTSVEMSPGVLATGQVTQLIKKGAITSQKSVPLEMDGSAFDLRLGTTGWQLAQGQRPATTELTELQAQRPQINLSVDSKGKYFLFEKGHIYLVRLAHDLNLPVNINGRATGKSSIGRLDVITRLLTNNSREYDVVEAGYSGPLFLLIQPQTFSIRVRPGQSLNQLRLFSGPPYECVINRASIGDFGTPFWYLTRKDRSEGYVPWDELVSEYGRARTADPGLFDLTVDLGDPGFPHIYKANNRADLDPIDLRKGKKSYDPTLCFERVPINSGGSSRSVILKRGSFYIMKSRERLHIPYDVAVEVVAISERIGDIRIHYAGFAHPRFGRHKGKVKKGTPLIFEVRATDMNTKLFDGSLLARIQLFRMSTKTKVSSSEYDEQELKLSSYFREWPSESE